MKHPGVGWRRWRPVWTAGAAALLLHLMVLGPGAARSAALPPARVQALQARWVHLPPADATTTFATTARDEAATAPDPLPQAQANAAQAASPADTAVPLPGGARAVIDTPKAPVAETGPGPQTAPAKASAATPVRPEADLAEAHPLKPAPAEPTSTQDPPASVAPAADAPVLLAAASVSTGGALGGVADSGDDTTPVPVYATRVAPPMRLSYRLQRGMVSGTAVLDWQFDATAQPGNSYELRLDARAGPLTLLSQHSQGRFDAAGLAPNRFTDQRLRGGQKAANFQRQRGVVSFSGPPAEFPLVPGVQDRLSWMLQLPAIVSAMPARVVASGPIVLQVIGARGDLAVWSFRLVGKEPVMTDGGAVTALKFLREPRKPNDTQVEVWLDPALHHLPVRARIGNPPEAEVFELLRLAR